jgi:cytochrome c biogenesis protein CcmG, thiol:disulfide interchange protein DsbE
MRTRQFPLLLLAVLLSACDLSGPVAVGAPVPGFESRDLTGQSLSLQDLRGEVVLLNIWATWCYPCRREMPAMEELHRDLAGDGLRIVAVSIDAAGSRPDIDDFLAEHDITFTILHDAEQRVTRTFRTRGVPETFLIGRDGTLLKHWIGRIDAHAPSVRLPVHEALDAPAI